VLLRRGWQRTQTIGGSLQGVSTVALIVIHGVNAGWQFMLSMCSNRKKYLVDWAVKRFPLCLTIAPSAANEGALVQILYAGQPWVCANGC